jgi:hypothetical protein
MPNKSNRKSSSKKKNSKGYRLKSNKKGGSLASVPVVDAANGNAPGMKGYKDHMHLPPMEELRGGSRASDRLSSFMTNKSTEPRSELLESNEFTNASMDGFRTDTYQLTGGAKGDMKKNLVALINVARKNPDMSADKLVENFHASRPMAGRVSEKDLKEGKPKMTQKGGNGFLSLAGCGPVNVPDAGRQYAGEFTKSGMCPGPEWYANPPNLGSAGSGMNDLGVGAPAL